MKTRRPTSKQVAELAGVSQTTVSFVLNNVAEANIREETRVRVLEAARVLNYTPDVTARSLARGRSDNIALVLAHPHRQVFIDEYLPRVLTGISEVTREHGLRILVEQVDHLSGSDAFRRLLHGREAAGMIVNFSDFTPPDLQMVLSAASEGMPIVSLSDVHPDILSVEVDKLGGVRAVIEHLVALGRRRIACIAYEHERNSTHVAHRLAIFRETLAAHGLPCDPALIRRGAYDPETGSACLHAMLDEAAPPDAVFAMNDMMAFGVLRALHERGLRVPEEIALAGFDDVRLAAFSAPPLTTVNEPDEEHGRRAAQMLVAMLNGEDIPEKHVTLHTRLIVRGSCGASLAK